MLVNTIAKKFTLTLPCMPYITRLKILADCVRLK